MAAKGHRVALAHAVPGRFRLHVDGLKGDPKLAAAITKRLAAVEGVTGVEANASTGSVVVRHERRSADWLADLGPIVQGLTPVVPHADAERVVAQVRRERHDAGHASRHVARFFRDVNAGVASSAGGVDLTLLVPAALVLLGLGVFANAERVVLPRWYELVWFGFGTFMLLNAAGVPRDKAVEEAAELVAAL